VSPRSVVVIGSGKRVRDVALPAFLRLEQRFAIRQVWARTEKRLEAAGRGIDVAPFAKLASQDLQGANLVYLAVAKDAVPSVLRRLTELDVRGIDLLIDTPVVRFKHFRHAARCRAFQSASVAEDCVELPWIQTVLAAVGPLYRVELDRSAWAYHGVATAKALLASTAVRRARRRPLEHGAAERVLHLRGGGVARIVEPRDYSKGRIVCVGQGGTLSDRPAFGEKSLPLEVELMGGAVSALRAGSTRLVLDADESDLTRGDPEDATLTARMEAMKRVGFLRLLRRLAEGRRGYAVEQALEDTVVDYALEKVGFYAGTPFTSPRSALGRGLLGLATSLGGS
jgi:hypothetical protein